MSDQEQVGEKARRRAAGKTIAAYHEQQLGLLLEHVREGFARMDAGEIDSFELDELIHRYKRSARELWTFCGQTGSDWVRAGRRDSGDTRRAWRRAPGLVGSRRASSPVSRCADRPRRRVGCSR